MGKMRMALMTEELNSVDRVGKKAAEKVEKTKAGHSVKRSDALYEDAKIKMEKNACKRKELMDKLQEEQERHHTKASGEDVERINLRFQDLYEDGETRQERHKKLVREHAHNEQRAED